MWSFTNLNQGHVRGIPWLNPSLGGKSVVWHHDGVEKYGKVILAVAKSHLENPRSGWQGSKSQNRSSVDAVADCPMYIYRYIDY